MRECEGFRLGNEFGNLTKFEIWLNLESSLGKKPELVYSVTNGVEIINFDIEAAVSVKLLDKEVVGKLRSKFRTMFKNRTGIMTFG